MKIFKTKHQNLKSDFRNLHGEIHNEQIAGDKVIRIIKSCATLEQLEVARNMVAQFHSHYGKKGVFDLLLGKKANELTKVIVN